MTNVTDKKVLKPFGKNVCRFCIKRVAVGLCALLTHGLVAAQNNYTEAFYDIQDLIIFSKMEPIYPSWAGYLQVPLTQPLVW